MKAYSGVQEYRQSFSTFAQERGIIHTYIHITPPGAKIKNEWGYYSTTLHAFSEWTEIDSFNVCMYVCVYTHTHINWMNQFHGRCNDEALTSHRIMVYVAVNVVRPQARNGITLTKNGWKLPPKCYKKKKTIDKLCPFPISHSVPFLLPLLLIFSSTIETGTFFFCYTRKGME